MSKLLKGRHEAIHNLARRSMWSQRPTMANDAIFEGRRATVTSQCSLQFFLTVFTAVFLTMFTAVFFTIFTAIFFPHNVFCKYFSQCFALFLSVFTAVFSHNVHCNFVSLKMFTVAFLTMFLFAVRLIGGTPFRGASYKGDSLVWGGTWAILILHATCVHEAYLQTNEHDEC